MTDIERLEGKVDTAIALLRKLLGEGGGRSFAELRRDAQATVYRLQERQKNRKKGHERAKSVGN